MRGLTPAEYAILAEPNAGGVEAREFASDQEEQTVETMIAHGRIETREQWEPDGSIVRYYTPSTLGLLALRLWPATMATPGAGDHQ